ncbi:MAG: leucine-rich repeat protein, partial [Clostridia bacterium]|nr:leucine-rich repeat protein [Clostridia bacterium]
TLTIPDSVTYIDEAAFYYCTNLTEMEIPETITKIPQLAFAPLLSHCLRCL